MKRELQSFGSYTVNYTVIALSQSIVNTCRNPLVGGFQLFSTFMCPRYSKIQGRFVRHPMQTAQTCTNQCFKSLIRASLTLGPPGFFAALAALGVLEKTAIFGPRAGGPKGGTDDPSQVL